ncbi:MAG: hypothetical protein A3D74_00200 [Candidatus Levybacteria bacterium RIFCSPHIGHO2_02_FULL_37_13]|nr:MAG: hypothetical protein A3D74_00200 [Candidatus Levybacteria bacterium RIFCSPHIGHO2_02_FULL_37_13]OGH29734.1 MAG: hypothetical protein A3E40_02905 [Candidatus Levybacteria bacterium RIFCSPHIGHO2_12_FULL_37_9]OGH39403.1 MAG: hypothetical protein A3B41_01385 [Candidatus Levybacteria bacterium RIFCSPLOWO2_01_FULL_37_26]
MKLVIDSSILIDRLRGGDNWFEFLQTSDQENILYIPTIVVFELYSGQSSGNPEEQKKIENLITSMIRIDLSEKIAQRAGRIFRDITRKLDVSDYIIAASALDIGGTVVTLNKKHFEQIPGLDLFDLP